MPGLCRDPTSFSSLLLLPGPFPFANSDLFSRQYMHQHPPQAPFSPKSASRSFHLPGVTG